MTRVVVAYVSITCTPFRNSIPFPRWRTSSPPLMPFARLPGPRRGDDRWLGRTHTTHPVLKPPRRSRRGTCHDPYRRVRPGGIRDRQGARDAPRVLPLSDDLGAQARAARDGRVRPPTPRGERVRGPRIP